jgi:hypothetical protein
MDEGLESRENTWQDGTQLVYMQNTHPT